MFRTKVIIELNNGEITALHAGEDLEFHIVNWDDNTESNEWPRKCRSPLQADRLIDKTFDYYMNEIING